MNVMKNFDLIIYHANCFDGWTAAWIAHKATGGTAELYAAQHYTDPPDCTGRRVLVVDFAYVPREATERMASQATDILILDHHKTNQQHLAGLPYVEFDMDRSGAGITWDYFHPNQERPPIVKHVEDRDLWRFQYPETKAYHAAMSRYPKTIEAWGEIASKTTEEMVAEGEILLSYISRIAHEFADNAYRMTVRGVDLWAVNCPPQFLSETAAVLYNRETEDGYLPVLCWSFDGEQYYCSLRSREHGIDVSDLAKSFGGGGHHHAAGFKTTSWPPA